MIAVCIASGSIGRAESSVSIQGYIAEKNVGQLATLANEWWQWVSAFPRLAKPTSDNTGAMCAFLQSEGPWFLANSDTPEIVNRSCEVPLGSQLFFPIISNIYFSPPSVDLTCAEVLEGVAFKRNPNYVVTVSLNGTSVKLDEGNIIRSASCFDLLARVPAFRNPPSYYPSATDGYWVLLEPLPAGDHELVLKAEYHDTQQNEVLPMVHVRYQLTVGEW